MIDGTFPHREGTASPYESLVLESGQAYSVTAGTMHTVELEDDARRIMLGNEPKQWRTAIVDGEEQAFVERPLDSRFIDTYENHRSVGLPVPSEVLIVDTDQRMTLQTRSMLVTDVTADGSAVYGKSLLGPGWSARRRAPSPELDARFMELTNRKNLPRVIALTHSYRDLATQAGLALPDDDPFELIIHPGGGWSIITLDLSNYSYPPGNERARDRNETSVGTMFLGLIPKMRERMEQERIVRRQRVGRAFRSFGLTRR
jgi:hypothetical protein